ncbi:MAG: efflux RND transporter periplasmic adaptor subunit [Chitinophagaceae bacterium]
MQKSIQIMFVVTTAALLAACGASNKTDEVAKKKARLEEVKKEQAKLTDEASKLEADIAKLDPASAKVEKAKLINTSLVALAPFTHYIDLQGKIEAENIAYVTPRGAGGQVKAIYVKQGDFVNKGKLLLKLDDVTALRQLEQLNVQLGLQKTLYERRKNLWDQKIGTEVDVLTAKNTVDNLNKQIELAKEQLEMTNVYAEMSGVADMVNIRVGEFFTAASAGTLGITIVNTSDLKVTANVPENYISNVKEGSLLQIVFPDMDDKKLTAKVNTVGKTINADARSFYIQAHLPHDKDLKPGQIALTRIQDYYAAAALTVPVNTLQTDDKGKFVLVAVKENGRLVAKKKYVTEGLMYGDKVEIKSGLDTGDAVITEGFQGLYEGQLVTTA